MIPLRDDVSSRSMPMVTIGLIVINLLVYLYELSLGAGGREAVGPGAAEAFVLEFGATPTEPPVRVQCHARVVRVEPRSHDFGIAAAITSFTFA